MLWWWYGPSTILEFQATAEWVTSSQTLVAAGTVVPPEFQATATWTTESQTLTATGTVIPPEFQATAAWTPINQTLSATGTTVVPEFTAVADWTTTNQTLIATGTVVPPEFQATATWLAINQTLTGIGAAVPPEFTAVANWIPTSQTLTATGATVPPEFTATASWLIVSQTLAATGTVVPPEFVAIASWVTTSQVLVVTGATVVPEFTATTDWITTSQILVATGTVAPPEFQATADWVVTGQTLGFTGETVVPEFTATAAWITSQQILEILAHTQQVVYANWVTTCQELIIEAALATWRAHPHGRHPTAINQPPGGGSLYPYTNPSNDIRYLLSDLYLSYDDPDCQYQEPFSTNLLLGFAEPFPGDPESIRHDMVIQDAQDQTVLDTREADQFQSKLWDDRLLILEWVSNTQHWVLRVVRHIAWEEADIRDGLAIYYPNVIEPENGQLDPRTIRRRPLRVRSLQTSGVQVTGEVIELSGGFNCEIATASDLHGGLTPALPTFGGRAGLQKAKRRTRQIHFKAEPGDGLGRVDGCALVVPAIKTLAGVEADASGNVRVELEGCLRAKRPTELQHLATRQFSYGHSALSPEEARAALHVHNDCNVCCDCDYYVRVYKGLQRQWSLHQNIANRLSNARDIHQENINRWEAEKVCREDNPFRLIWLPEYDCKMAGSISYCNITGCCISPLILRITFHGHPTNLQGYDCKRSLIAGSPFDGEQPYRLSGSWPVFEARFDYANPGASSLVNFRICIADCEDAALQYTVTAHFPENLTHEDPDHECRVPEASAPTNLQNTWSQSSLGSPAYPARSIQSSSLRPMNHKSAYCDTCEC